MDAMVTALRLPLVLTPLVAVLLVGGPAGAVETPAVRPHRQAASAEQIEKLIHQMGDRIILSASGAG